MSSAGYVVDAFVVVLKQIVGAEKVFSSMPKLLLHLIFLSVNSIVVSFSCELLALVAGICSVSWREVRTSCSALAFHTGIAVVSMHPSELTALYREVVE